MGALVGRLPQTDATKATPVPVGDRIVRLADLTRDDVTALWDFIFGCKRPFVSGETPSNAKVMPAPSAT